jgi:hypothetical protein
VCTLTGTDGPDDFVIQMKPSDPIMTVEFSDDNGASFVDAALAAVAAVQADGLGGRDQLIIHNDIGLVGKFNFPLFPISFDGGSGYNTVVLDGAGLKLYSEFTAGNSADAGTFSFSTRLGFFTLGSELNLSHIAHIFDTMQTDFGVLEGGLIVNANSRNNAILIYGGVTPLDGAMTNTIVGLDERHLNDDGGFHNNSDFLAVEPTPAGGDDSDHGHNEDNPFEAQASRGFIGITYTGKAHVAVNALGGDDAFIANVATVATGQRDLTLNGGDGADVLAVIAFPSSGTLSGPNIEYTVSDRSSIFVHLQYELRLGRPAEVGAVDAWNGVLAAQGPAAVATAIDHALEARAVFVRHLYERYLARDPVGDEANGWVAALYSGAFTEKEMLQQFLSSPEFVARTQTIVSSGTPDERYVRGLYRAALGRDGSDVEVQAWVRVIPDITRAGVADDFVLSFEFRANFVITLYNDILHRVPVESEVQAWATSALSLLLIREDILGSMEAFFLA